MTLIKSISGIRGTIGGKPGEGLSPVDMVKFSTGYAGWVKESSGKKRPAVVIGRDARPSGDMVQRIISGTLMSMGVDVIDLGLATTPTVEIAVDELKADGGIILTASHNPKQWNALKLLNNRGEFVSGAEGRDILTLAEDGGVQYANVDELGKITEIIDYEDIHIQKILDLPLVDVEAIRKANFKIAIDCVNSVGGMVLPKLLKSLGVAEIIELYCEPNGQFPHNPEPLPEHLTEITSMVKDHNASLGFVVDPDVDRLAIVNEDGSMFGEEYTLVAIADYILSNHKGNTVSNLSSTRALKDITEQYGGTYKATAVGEVNVVETMKETNAIIGGEGNGGVIYPALHYGRDALVGIALFLSYLALSGKSCSQLRAGYPDYVISKNKIELTPAVNVDEILQTLIEKNNEFNINTQDGVKIEYQEGWVHLRKSNTEPIIRVYAEAGTMEMANQYYENILQQVNAIL
ncbi:MAG: phosphoglucosamine mutase [Bacteroidetes bacterium]|jgi:phosphomannomutase|nr:phosphoglucosamine mutase [Bacteroidota bacterium]